MVRPASTKAPNRRKEETMSELKHIDAKTAHDWVAAGEAVIVDIREPFELIFAQIEGTVQNPMSSFDMDKMPTDGGKKIVLICAHGNRTVYVGQYLLDKGLMDEVYNLVGGIQAWEQAGLPTTSSCAA